MPGGSYDYWAYSTGLNVSWPATTQAAFQEMGVIEWDESKLKARAAPKG